MLSIVCFAGVALLAALAVTRHRTVILAGFYCFFVLLKILGEFAVPHLGPLTIYRALYLILGISIVSRWIQDPSLVSQARRWPWLAYFFLIILVFASSLYSISGQSISWESDWNLWNHAVVMLLFLIAACHIQRQADLNVFAAGTVIVSLVLSLFVIRSAAQLDFEAYRGGLSTDQNYISEFVFLGMLTLVNVIFTGVSRWRFLWAPVLLCEMFASLILASRGMFVSFFAAALWMLVSTLRGRGRWAVVSVIAILVLVAGTALLLPGGQALLGRFQEGDLRNLDFRMLIWSGALEYFANSGFHRMVFGQGLGSAPVVIGPIVPDLLNYHNEYLRWLMDQGVVGLAAILFFFYSAGRKVLNTTHPLKHLMMGWLIFFMVTGLSETLADEHVFWLFMGLLASGAALASGPMRVSQFTGKFPVSIRPRTSTTPHSTGAI